MVLNPQRKRKRALRRNTQSLSHYDLCSIGQVCRNGVLRSLRNSVHVLRRCLGKCMDQIRGEKNRNSHSSVVSI